MEPVIGPTRLGSSTRAATPQLAPQVDDPGGPERVTPGLKTWVMRARLPFPAASFFYASLLSLAGVNCPGLKTEVKKYFTYKI